MSTNHVLQALGVLNMVPQELEEPTRDPCTPSSTTEKAFRVSSIDLMLACLCAADFFAVFS